MGNSISYTTSNCYVNLANGAGAIKGVQFDRKSRRFAGVPYAQPPVSNLRWRLPQPFPASHIYSDTNGEPYDGTKFGPVCPQAAYSKTVSEHIPKHLYDEDCLRLNIWTPVPKSQDSDSKWPVVIWFHGGWFQIGDPSQEEAMDPTELISTGKLKAIFVSVGYRLNVFGFLAGDALKEETDGKEVGNYGLWDQRLAIDWVHQNIAAFGGDPANVTLAGRSAGAYAVQAQTMYAFQADHPSKAMFHRMLMISNAIPTQPKTPEECQLQFDELCHHFHIPASSRSDEKLKQLRQLSAQDLCAALTELNQNTFRPVTDGIFILPNIFEYLQNGSFAAEFKRRKMRIFIGEVLNEETLYAVTNGPEANQESLELRLSNYYSMETTQRLLHHYTLPQTSNLKDWQSVFGQIIADGQVRAPSRFFVNNLLVNDVSINDVWRYCIAYRLSFIDEKVAPPSFGVSHAMDRPFWK